MTPDAWYTLVVLAVMFLGLVTEFLGADIVLGAALLMLWSKGIISAEEAFSGFNNPQVLTIAMLFAVSAGMQRTGGLNYITRFMLGKELGRKRVLARLLIPTAAMSGFLNNTPIVAMLTPAVRDWALRHSRAPSKFLIPLSYAAILGGTCTLIGTSTNLVVSGLLQEYGYRPFGMFELTQVGFAAAVVGLLFLLVVGKRFLPDRRSPEQKIDDNSREYAVTLEVKKECPLVGQSVEEAGLRNLRGLFLVEIQRGERMIAPVRRTNLIQQGDRLTFFGVADTVIDLQKIQGLVPVTEDGSAERRRGRERRMFEVVVSNNSPLVGQTLKDASFRRRYDAAVIALHRGGVRLRTKLGEIRLRSGDTLMVEAAPGFRSAWANTGDFYLVSRVDDDERPDYRRAPIAFAILVVMVVAMATGMVPILMATSLAAMAMILTGCLTPTSARDSIDLTVFVVIAASFGIGKAVFNSGLADFVSVGIIGNIAGNSPLLMLIAIYLLTAVATELMSNNAAAALLVPIALTTASSQGFDARPFAIAVAVAASMSFITPLGYQTNLMVYGPGGYRFSDFVRIGIPMAILAFITSMIVIPLVWPLTG